ncbi:auxin-induced protein AUX22 [Tanacetum coccineum]
MAIEGFGFEITELRLGLPGGCGERNEKKRAFLERRTMTKNLRERTWMGLHNLRIVDVKSFSNGYSDLFWLLKSLRSENLFGLGDECEYTPIYEDKDGDWMLVGDDVYRNMQTTTDEENGFRW